MNGKIKILSIILVIVVLLAIGAGAFLKFFRGNEAKKPAEQPNQQTNQNSNQQPATGNTTLPDYSTKTDDSDEKQQTTYNEKLKEVIDTEYRLFLGLRSYTEPPHDPAVKVIPSNVIGQYPGPFYRTLIIDFKNIEKPVSEAQDLYFFKNGEFWNAGVIRALYDKKWMEDLIYAAPMSQEPYLQKPDYNRMRISSGTDTTIINYICKDLMSVSFATEGTDPGLVNNWAYGKLAVLPVENMSNLYEYNVLISEIFGEDGKKVMLEESNKAYLRSKNSDRLLQYSDEANWGLTHSQGKLSLIGRLDYNAEVGKGYYEDYKIPLDLSSLFNNTACYPSWDIIKGKVSDARDAVSSPDKKVLLVLTNKELILYKVVDEKTWNEILRFPLKENEQIIMSEWDSNTEEMKKLMDSFTAAQWYERLLHVY